MSTVSTHLTTHKLTTASSSSCILPHLYFQFSAFSLPLLVSYPCISPLGYLPQLCLPLFCLPLLPPLPASYHCSIFQFPAFSSPIILSYPSILPMVYLPLLRLPLLCLPLVCLPQVCLGILPHLPAVYHCSAHQCLPLLPPLPAAYHCSSHRSSAHHSLLTTAYR